MLFMLPVPLQPGDAAPSAQTSVLQGDRKEAQQEVSNAADPSSPWRAPEGGQRPASSAHGTGPGVGVQTVRASLFENVVERHSVQMMMDDGWASTAGLAATAQGAARNRRPGRSISLRGRADLQGAPTSSISNNNNGDDDDDGSLVMAVYREPAPPSSPECVEHMFETVPGAGEKRAVSESVALAPLEERALTLRTRRSEGGAAAQRDLDLMSRPELGAQEGGPEWSGHRLGQEVALGTNVADEPSSTRYLRVGSLQGLVLYLFGLFELCEILLTSAYIQTDRRVFTICSVCLQFHMKHHKLQNIRRRKRQKDCCTI